MKQLELRQYTPNLNGVDLPQFMNLIKEDDFKQYGIHEYEHCRRLSMAAQSIKYSIEEQSNDINTTHTATSTRTNISSENNSISETTGHNIRREEALPEYEEHTNDTSRVILDRGEPPEYSYTLRKMGRASAKFEFVRPNRKPLLRRWKDVYLNLEGTKIKLYQMQPPHRSYYYSPLTNDPDTFYFIMKLSLKDAQVEIPLDYTKRPNVFRLSIKDGPQILFQAQSYAAVMLWMEKIALGN